MMERVALLVDKRQRQHYVKKVQLRSTQD